jgi:hypothetical protein
MQHFIGSIAETGNRGWFVVVLNEGGRPGIISLTSHIIVDESAKNLSSILEIM